MQTQKRHHKLGGGNFPQNGFRKCGKRKFSAKRFCKMWKAEIFRIVERGLTHYITGGSYGGL